MRPGHQTRERRGLHLGIDLRILDTPGSEHTGLGRYALEVTRALAEVRPAWRISVFTNRLDLLSEESNVERKTTRWPTSRSIGRILWLHAGALSYRFRNTPDVWFGPTFVLPVWWSGPSVVTVQDLVFLLMPERYRGRFNAFHAGAATRLSVHRASRVICPSHETHAAVQRELEARPEKLVVIPDGVAEIFFSTSSAPESRSSNEALPYLLFVGTFEARKGLDTLREAIRALNRPTPRVRLVLAGRPGWGTEGIVDAMVGDGDTEVVLSPTDDALLSLYARALAVVFPSRMEGFGLPVAEGLAVGTPVIASNLACIREFAGDAPLYIEPGSDHELRAQVERLLHAGGEATGSRELRRRAVSHLRWREIGEVTAQTIEAAAAGRPTASA